MIEFGEKPSQRGIFIAALPGCDDLFLLPFSHKRDKDNVVGVVEPVGTIIGQKRNALFRRDHHQDALGVRRAEENVGLVARLNKRCMKKASP